MGRALLGLIKGLILGGAMGYALLRTGLGQGLLAYLACGVLGATVGLVCGKAPWRAETIWTPVLKMIFGLLAGTGLYALGHRFAPELAVGKLIPVLPPALAGLTLNSGVALAPAIGMLYGAFVEIDDGGSDRERLESGRPAKALPKTAD